MRGTTIEGDDGFAPLRLPDGRVVRIAGGPPRDLSVMGALKALSGAWESHVGAFFAQTVQPDWVCVDIGANLGTHTLALASLATRGWTYGLEAAPETFERLLGNIASAGLAGRATAERIAIWCKAGQLRIAVCEELEGCAFVSDEAGMAVDIATSRAEQRLRSVVDNPAIANRPLHITSSLTPAMRLDDWVESKALKRLDLIKVDVEGAEWRVLEGATRTLADHRPLMVTEYNPSCAEAHFFDTPWRYHDLLSARFVALFEITATGLSRLPNWAELERRIALKGWCDLVCASTEAQMRMLDALPPPRQLSDLKPGEIR